MLEPAIIHREELLELFSREIYSKDYFYFTACAGDYSLPIIEEQTGKKQFAILSSKNKVIGYLSYRIDLASYNVYGVTVYSFDRGNPTIGKDLYSEMEKLYEKFHRIEFTMISGNPAQKAYDKFCKKHNGNCVNLHDVLIDEDGIYHDQLIYEVLAPL